MHPRKKMVIILTHCKFITIWFKLTNKSAVNFFLCLIVMPSRNYESMMTCLHDLWFLPLIRPRDITRVLINGHSIPQEFPWIGNFKLGIRFWSNIPTFSCYTNGNNCFIAFYKCSLYFSEIALTDLNMTSAKIVWRLYNYHKPPVNFHIFSWCLN